MDLREIRDAYIDDGLEFQNATARTCRDVVLSLISASRMADHVTVALQVDVQLVGGTDGYVPSTTSGASLMTIYADSTWALPSSGVSGSQCFD